jgi:hypothetical protein
VSYSSTRPEEHGLPIDEGYAEPAPKELRDIFAAFAMHAAMVNGLRGDVAAQAYQAADQMLAARTKR